MANMYTVERNAQILLYLMKAHGIKKIVASPGTTNVAFIASAQIDDFFEIYSAPDERSAAYIACGIAIESGRPVALSCTGATASRNYYPGLTEAFYSKLPILAITSSRRSSRIGHNFDQVTDRTQLANDIAKMSVQLPIIFDSDGEWACEIAVNKAILELQHNGNGPVHINLETEYNNDFTVKTLPSARVIHRYSVMDNVPAIKYNKVAIVVGYHLPMNAELTKAIDKFCEVYNGIVICDHVSNYHGKYGIFANLSLSQRYYTSIIKNTELVIHIGEISSSDFSVGAKEVWRVSEDGLIKDTYFKLTNVFETSEFNFFRYYSAKSNNKTIDFYKSCIEEERIINNLIPELPFSNAWTAKYLTKNLPQNVEIHLGIRNSLRCWNFFSLDKSLDVFSNTGGFGIDGSLSTVLGASLCNKNKIYYCILGDLAFFYDINALGNRHFGNNVRILLVNNGTGMEMRFSTFYASMINAEKDSFISASGHYGKRDNSLARNVANALGIKYLSATNKDEFISNVKEFIAPDIKQSIIFEVFTDEKLEDESFNTLCSLAKDTKGATKEAIKSIIGDSNIKKIKKILSSR